MIQHYLRQAVHHRYHEQPQAPTDVELYSTSSTLQHLLDNCALTLSISEQEGHVPYKKSAPTIQKKSSMTNYRKQEQTGALHYTPSE